jgi:E217 gateway protein gp29
MNDNALIAILIQQMELALAAQNITVGIQQRNQPTQQGVPSSDTIFLEKLGDNRYGFKHAVDTWDPTAGEFGTMTHTETTWLETHFQIGALAIQIPSSTVQLTAADYVKAVSRGLQNEGIINNLLAQGVGIYRIRDIKQTYFQDDKGRYESSPIVEITVTHSDVMSVVITSTNTLVPNIHPSTP